MLPSERRVLAAKAPATCFFEDANTGLYVSPFPESLIISFRKQASQ